MDSKVDLTEVNRRLQKLWDPDGFFFGLREGRFSQAGYEDLVATLNAIPEWEGPFPIDTLRLLWDIPHVMMYQRERIEESGTMSLGAYVTRYSAVIDELRRIWA